MDSTTGSTGIDVAPETARPGLALILALLSIPGSTLAWDLPAGGLWIGLPLAVAAIALAVQARRRGAGGGKATAAIVISGLMIVQMIAWTLASAL
jgi:hypothetical protein